MKTKGEKDWDLFCIGTLLVLLFFFPRQGFGQEASGAPKSAPEVASKPKIVLEPERMTFPVKEEVKILRQERRQKMPYLDRGYLKETISLRSLQAKQTFVQKEEKTLKEVIHRSTEVYTPVKAAKEKMTLAKRRILVATRELFPEMSLNFELRKGSLSRDAFSGRDYHLTFRLPVFRGGILWNTLRREKAEYRAAKKDYDATLNELVEEASKAYFEFNRARETYEDKEAMVQRAERQHTLSKKKFEQALISEIEYLNVESMAGQFRYDLETAEQELELAKLELQRFLDLDVRDQIAVTALYDAEALIEKAKPPSPGAGEGPEKRLSLGRTLDEFIDLSYQNRPELQVEAEQLRASRLEEQIKRGVFLPRADLLMEFGEMGESFIKDADDPTHHPEWRLGLEVSSNLFGSKVKYTFDNDENAPSVAQFLQGSGSQVTRRKMEVGILDSLKDYAELKEAQVKKLEQVIELEKKEREVIRDVKEAYFDYHKAQIQVESSLKRNQYRQKLIELAQLRLEKAEIEISDYLQAESDLAEERSRLHRALADLFKSKSKMNRAIGIPDFLPMEEQYAF